MPHNISNSIHLFGITPCRLQLQLYLLCTESSQTIQINTQAFKQVFRHRAQPERMYSSTATQFQPASICQGYETIRDCV